MRLNLNYRGQLAKLCTKDGGFYFGKTQGLKQKRKDLFAIIFELDWTEG